MVSIIISFPRECLVLPIVWSIWIFKEICLIVILFISLYISLFRQCLVLTTIFFSQFGFSGKSVLLFSLSSAFLSVFPDSLLYLYFRGNVSCCHLIHQSVFQSFQPVSCSSSVNLDVLVNLS